MAAVGLLTTPASALYKAIVDERCKSALLFPNLSNLTMLCLFSKLANGDYLALP
jgi:hypothetical protein